MIRAVNATLTYGDSVEGRARIILQAPYWDPSSRPETFPDALYVDVGILCCSAYDP